MDARERKRYIDTLANYQMAVGQLSPRSGVWPRPDLEGPFRALCQEAYGATRALIAQARGQQARRRSTGQG